MIERPKRSVTRFFIPLIDVLILLFCIFLLMPIMNQPGLAEPIAEKEEKQRTPLEIRQELASVRIDLDRARRELERLKKRESQSRDNTNLFVIDVDPKDGRLFYYKNGRRVELPDEREALRIVDALKADILGRDPLVVILLPREDVGFPSGAQVERYRRWFRDVPVRVNSPFAR
jgi:hypothetical protein